MKKRLSIISFMFLIIVSCNNNQNTDNLNSKNTNKEYYPLKNDLVKVVCFFPDTKDTSAIYFWNKYKKRKDSVAYYFDKEGYKTEEIIYKIENNTKTRKIFYKNGNVQEEFTVKGNKRNRTTKTYYNTGELKTISEIIYKDSMDYLNRELYYNKNGKLNKDSTYYVEMICSKDTISINDSVKIKLKVIKPDYVHGYAVIGSIDKYFDSDIEYDDIIKRKPFYYKPKHLGINYIEIVFVYFRDDSHYELRTFLKKKIFVKK